MEIILLLMSFLFIGGLIKISFYIPTKKFYDWLQFFVPRCSSSSSTYPVSTPNTSTSQLISDKESSSSSTSTSELKRVFATFDKDGDGFITKKELKESLKNLRIMVSEDEVEELITKVDSNGDGLIDFDEFCFLCDESSFLGKESGDQKGGGGDLKEAFDVFDKDKDGLISVEELSSVLDSLGLKEGRKIEDCKEMIRRVDVDGDGMVNFDEFKLMMMMRGGGSRLVSVF